jgi:flagellar operon protein
VIDKIQGPALPEHGAAAAKPRKTQNGGEAFGSMLREQIETRGRGAQAVNFSKHALERAEERGIELTPQLMEQLSSSVEKAQEKGAKNILAFDDSRAFIINIPYGRVITTMSQEEMKENIFTNIDGAVLL